MQKRYYVFRLTGMFPGGREQIAHRVAIAETVEEAQHDAVAQQSGHWPNALVIRASLTQAMPVPA